jgi:proteic killer suppression protein
LLLNALSHFFLVIIPSFLKGDNNYLNLLSCFWGVPNRLEKLKGDLKEFYSIRINNQWRIIFKWINNDAYEIKIVDYH